MAGLELITVLALIEYAHQHPDMAQFVGMLLAEWEEKLPSGSYPI